MPRQPTFDESGRAAAKRSEPAQELPDIGGVDEPQWALSPAFRAELERRLEAHRLNPDQAETWEVVEAEVLRLLAQDRASAA